MLVESTLFEYWINEGVHSVGNRLEVIRKAQKLGVEIGWTTIYTYHTPKSFEIKGGKFFVIRLFYSYKHGFKTLAEFKEMGLNKYGMDLIKKAEG